jgi:L-cysteine S-thiosulfotransferase
LSARIIFFAAAVGTAAVAAAQSLVAYRIEGDTLRAPLTNEPGDPVRGRSTVLNRNEGGCILCHAVPGAGSAENERFMGNLAPSLAGIGAKRSPAQLRLRIVDSTRIDPATPMPAYYRIEGLNRVASAYRGKPILSAQQVEDVVAYLATLTAAPK